MLDEELLEIAIALELGQTLAGERAALTIRDALADREELLHKLRLADARASQIEDELAELLEEAREQATPC